MSGYNSLLQVPSHFHSPRAGMRVYQGPLTCKWAELYCVVSNGYKACPLLVQPLVVFTRSPNDPGVWTDSGWILTLVPVWLIPRWARQERLEPVFPLQQWHSATTGLPAPLHTAMLFFFSIIRMYVGGHKCYCFFGKTFWIVINTLLNCDNCNWWTTVQYTIVFCHIKINVRCRWSHEWLGLHLGGIKRKSNRIIKQWETGRWDIYKLLTEN